jgi:hypothetical protein
VSTCRLHVAALLAALALTGCGRPERARDEAQIHRAPPLVAATLPAAASTPATPVIFAATDDLDAPVAAPTPAAPAAAPGPKEHEPRAMVVPPRLQARTCNIEPSGIAWCPKLKRYLIVSDDTGLRDAGTNHAPWLFAMDGEGNLDPEPVPIQGVEKLNDPEAITAGPHGSFYLITSHSPDKKDRTRPERRMLLHLDVNGRALRVLGRLDLTEARDRDGRGLLALAGVPESGRLDIEGLAWHEGALYIGMKSPLTKDGRAVILKLAVPATAFQAGRIPPGALTRWAEVALQVPTPKGPVSQGIADLFFMPDGSLVLLANSPKGMPHDGGGAIWWLRRPGPGTHTPVLQHRYAGLAPEGVTLAVDGKSLIVVFDRNQEPPWWSRRPLPR